MTANKKYPLISAFVPGEDEEGLRGWLDEIQARYQPVHVFLFGSRARGSALKDSDYDFLIVSSAFEDIPFTDRMTAIYKTWPLRRGLDCLCLTPAEFHRAKGMISLVAKIADEGVAL